MTQQLKAHALYCWLTSLDLSRPPKGKHKSTAPATKVKALMDKKLTYAQFYQELCRWGIGTSMKNVEVILYSKLFII